MSGISERMASIQEALGAATGDERRNIVPMIYNLAADAWSGWEGEPIVEEADRAVGLEAAKLNIQLAQELDFEPSRRKNGYWILGAHLLENGDSHDAEAAFKTSHDLTCQTDDKAAQLMTQGWILACQLYRGEAVDEALDKVKEDLGTLGDDGVFYAGQYSAALDKFMKS